MIAGITGRRADVVELESIGSDRLRSKRHARRGTAGRVFSALAHARVNVKMIDQGSSACNIIIGVKNDDFEKAIRLIYDIFTVKLQLWTRAKQARRDFLAGPFYLMEKCGILMFNTEYMPRQRTKRGFMNKENKSPHRIR